MNNFLGMFGSYAANTHQWQSREEDPTGSKLLSPPPNSGFFQVIHSSEDRERETPPCTNKQQKKLKRKDEGGQPASAFKRALFSQSFPNPLEITQPADEEIQHNDEESGLFKSAGEAIHPEPYDAGLALPPLNAGLLFKPIHYPLDQQLETPSSGQKRNALKRKQPDQVDESDSVPFVKKASTRSSPSPVETTQPEAEEIQPHNGEEEPLESTVEIVDPHVFKEIFDKYEDIPDIEPDSYLCLSSHETGPMMTSGVGTCLALGVKSYDADGNLLFRAIGHFSSADIVPFGEDKDGGRIQALLDKACSESFSREIYMAGMYDEEQFAKVRQRIKQDYRPTKIEEFINPWEIPGDRLRYSNYDQDLEDYLCVRRASLTMGMTPEGNIYLADDNRDAPFEPFDEEEFELWRVHRQALYANNEASQLEPFGREQPVSMNVVKKSEFDEIFPEDVLDLDTDDAQLLSGDQISPMVTKGVACCLALGVRCFDSNGKLLYTGLGHFDNAELEAFNAKQDEHPIRDLLNKAQAISPDFEVFAAGMHCEEDFEAVRLVIETFYRPKKIETMINPWKIPQNASERPDQGQLEEYIDCWGGALCMGITETGDIYIADEPCKPSPSSDFLEFSEEIFEQWKQGKIEQKALAASE